MPRWLPWLPPQLLICVPAESVVARSARGLFELNAASAVTRYIFVVLPDVLMPHEVIDLQPTLHSVAESCSADVAVG